MQQSIRRFMVSFALAGVLLGTAGVANAQWNLTFAGWGVGSLHGAETYKSVPDLVSHPVFSISQLSPGFVWVLCANQALNGPPAPGVTFLTDVTFESPAESPEQAYNQRGQKLKGVVVNTPDIEDDALLGFLQAQQEQFGNICTSSTWVVIAALVQTFDNKTTIFSADTGEVVAEWLYSCSLKSGYSLTNPPPPDDGVDDYDCPKATYKKLQ